MADITARLIWYRLGEVAESVRDYVLDEDVDILDILFAFWVVVAGIILLIVYGVEWLGRRSRTFKVVSSSDEERWNTLRRQHSFFLDPEERDRLHTAKKQPSPMTSVDGIVREAPIRRENATSAQTSSSNSARVDGPVAAAADTSCHWLNRLMTWMFLNYTKPPQWLDDWLKTLNDEMRVRSRGQTNSLRLLRILPGGLPPKLLSFRCEPDDDTRCLFLRGQVALPELGFRAQITPQGHQCDVTIRNLTGELRIAVGMSTETEGVRVVIKFGSRPRMEIAVTQPLDQNASLPLDVDWIRRQVVRVLEEAVTEVTFPGPQLANKGDSRGVDAVLADVVAASSQLSPPAVHVTIADDNGEERVIVPRHSRSSATAPEVETEVKQRHHRSSKEKARPASSGSIPRFFTGQRTFGSRSPTSNGSVSRPLVLAGHASTPPEVYIEPHQQKQSPPSPKTQPAPPRLPPSPEPPRQPSPRPSQLQQQQQDNSGTLQSSSKRSASPSLPSPMRTPIRGLAKGQSVLAKVIKANGLPSRRSRARERSLYCVVEMDEPYQRNATGAVCGAASAFWDQGFVLELNSNSQRITFAVFDGDSDKSTCLGQTVVPLSDLMAHPSSRQIIPLTCEPLRHRSKEREAVAAQASITVEFLFLLPSPGTSGDALVVATATAPSSAQQPTPPPPLPAGGVSSGSSVASTLPSTTSSQAVTSRDLADFMAPPETAAALSKVAPVQMRPRDRPHSSVLPSSTNSTAPRLQLDIPAISLEPNRLEVLPPERGRPIESERQPPVKRSRSFASRLRRTFGGKGKERSKSADRASAPHAGEPPALPNGVVSTSSSHSDLQRSKSSGLSGSFRRLFGGRKAKRQAGSEGAVPFVAPSEPPLISGAATLPRLSPRRRPPSEVSSYSSEGYNLQSRESLL